MKPDPRHDQLIDRAAWEAAITASSLHLPGIVEDLYEIVMFLRYNKTMPSNLFVSTADIKKELAHIIDHPMNFVSEDNRFKQTELYGRLLLLYVSVYAIEELKKKGDSGC